LVNCAHISYTRSLLETGSNGRRVVKSDDNDHSTEIVVEERKTSQKQLSQLQEKMFYVQAFPAWHPPRRRTLQFQAPLIPSSPLPSLHLNTNA
jgi:hypothetical protein